MDLNNKLETTKLETEKLVKLIFKAESIDSENIDFQELDRVLFFTLLMYGICSSDLYHMRNKLEIPKNDLEKMDAFYFAYNQAKHTTIFKITDEDLSYGSIVGYAILGRAQIGKAFGIVWSKLKNKRKCDQPKYAAYIKYLEGKKILDTISIGIDLIEKYYPKLIEIYQ